MARKKSSHEPKMIVTLSGDYHFVWLRDISLQKLLMQRGNGQEVNVSLSVENSKEGRIPHMNVNHANSAYYFFLLFFLKTFIEKNTDIINNCITIGKSADFFRAFFNPYIENGHRLISVGTQASICIIYRINIKLTHLDRMREICHISMENWWKANLTKDVVK